MFGTYAWNVGATSANVVADLVALICGGAVADLSASCNKPASSVAGVASGFTALDAPYGVVQQPGVAGGPGRFARLTVSGANRIQLQAVDQWVMGSHSATFATSVLDASNVITAAGAVNFFATDAGLLLAASDWASWAMLAEVKRDGPAMADALAPGCFTLGGYYCYMPRIKAPTAVGDTAAASVTFTGAYGSMSASAARDRSERLYIPMAPAMVSFSSVPVGEVSGVFVTGGYGQSGDFMLDSGGDTFVIARTPNGLLVAFPKK